MSGVPETTNFMIAGYAVIFVGFILYLISLFVRYRNLHQDEKMLDDLEEKK